MNRPKVFSGLSNCLDAASKKNRADFRWDSREGSKATTAPNPRRVGLGRRASIYSHALRNIF